MLDIENILSHCRTWASGVAKIGSKGIYIFGSTVNHNGDQFDPQHSDIDLIVEMPADLGSAPRRTDWVVSLQKLKHELEVSLIPLLGRQDASKPIVSIVPITEFELRSNIHKSGVRNFFTANLFTNLLDNKASPVRLHHTRPYSVSEEVRLVAQFCQKTRNDFLAISASGTTVLKPWQNDSDPIPKDIMRNAAIASWDESDLPNEARFDVREGLDKISTYLYGKRDTDPRYLKLHNWLSVRRKGRGKAGALRPDDYMCLVEVTLDITQVPRAHKPKSILTGDHPASKIRHSSQRISPSSYNQMTRINGYKLFYFRANHKLTFRDLTRATGLDRGLLRSLERVDQQKGDLNASWFAKCDRQVLTRLEDILDCRGKLEVGKSDDFLTQYMMFYQIYKGRGPTKARDAQQDKLILQFQTKVVVFDFDGTLTYSIDDKTTWERIWVALGYSTEECADLHRRFQQNEFTHQQWCDKTCRKFAERKLHIDVLTDITRGISLIDGVAETVSELRKRGIRIYILSGSIKSIIKQTLGNLYSEFEEIRANDLIFDPSSGVITQIQGTRYDFRGKATFLKGLITDLRISPSDILFVGNSCNDIFASESGVRTLCVNARYTDPDNKEHWTYAIREMTNLSQILKYATL